LLYESTTTRAWAIRRSRSAAILGMGDCAASRVRRLRPPRSSPMCRSPGIS